MDRRIFLKLSGSLLLSLNGCYLSNKQQVKGDYDLGISADMEVGHTLMQAQNFPRQKIQNIQTLIVGGGIAGVTAAYQLKDKPFMLCELSKGLGGSSSGFYYQGIPICQGAHYDLNYPNYFGEDLMHFLKELDVIVFNPATKYWDFKEQQFIIEDEISGQSKVGNQYRDDVLYGIEQSDVFLNLMSQFHGKMLLPTRLIDRGLSYLNKVSFKTFLEKHFQPKKPIIQAINYQMLDDFGATYDQVSALAGVYYYASRPYWGKEERVFSPPQGNYYFIEKMLQKIPQNQIHLEHLVYKIQKVKEGQSRFQIEVVDVLKQQIFANQLVKEFKAKTGDLCRAKTRFEIVLPRQLIPDDSRVTYSIQNQYAPWLVINFVLKQQIFEEAYWQNEVLGENHNFLGFVDSAAQYKTSQDQQDFYGFLLL